MSVEPNIKFETKEVLSVIYLNLKNNYCVDLIKTTYVNILLAKIFDCR